MVSVRGGGLVLALVATACFADNGPPLASASSTSSTADATSGPATISTTSGSDSATGTSGGLTSSGATAVTGTTVTGTTGDPVTTDPGVCAGPGEPCGSGCCGCLDCKPDTKQCAPSDAKCGTCEQCDPAGTCALAPPSTPCSVPDAMCQATVFGPFDGTCYAYAAATGSCDAAGQCLDPTCAGQGAPIASCASAACTLEDQCAPGSPADTVSFATLCVTEGTTPACTPTCSDEAFVSAIELLACDARGDCVKADENDCGGYKCADDGVSCLDKCGSDGDCIAGLVCTWNQCVQP